MPTYTRKTCQSGEGCDPRNFEEAADCQAHHSPRRLPEMAKRMHRDYNYLAKSTSPNADQHPLRGDLIVPLTLESAEDSAQRNFALLDWMEAAVGRVAFVVPALQMGAFDSAGLRHATEAIQEFGALLAKYSSSLADGRVTADELAEIQALGRNAIQALAVLMSYAEQLLPMPVSSVSGPRPVEAARR